MADKVIQIADELDPNTAELVCRFAEALAAKLYRSQLKYGFSDGWKSPGWRNECLSRLQAHVGKGDPRDVAAYCAFAWHHGWSTSAEAAQTVNDPV